MQPTDATVDDQPAQACAPQADPICGAAFPSLTKAIASLAMAAVVASGVRAADQAGWPSLTVPELRWLLVPRLVVRAGGGLTTFHAGTPALVSAFRRLAYGQD